MKRSQQFALGAGICLLLAALLALPALASSNDDRPALLGNDDVILRGIDLWVTPADGRTHSDFAEQPIPAGFFCEGSAPFSGKILFKGGGLQTAPANAIGGADTIIERMDDAIFDTQGQASTRIRFLALSLTSIEPVNTECGQFQASIRLEGEQPVTSMQIQRREADSGTYSSQLSVNARLTFTPLDTNGEPLSMLQQVRFMKNQGAPWARTPGQSARPAANFARVDVDGDGQAETAIPSPSNFYPGLVLFNGVPTQPENAAGSALLSATALSSTSGCHCDPTQSFSAPAEETLAAISLPTTCSHYHCPSSPGVLQPAEEVNQELQ